MLSFWQALTSSNFMPHGQSFYWRADLLTLHVVGDGITALSYYVIPAALIVFVYRRSKQHNDVRFGWVFLMFAGFILACGTTHLLHVWTIWTPHYWLLGWAKMITAGISATTAFVIWPLIPQAVSLPSQAELEATNNALQLEISKRRDREAELERVNAELDRLNAQNLERRRLAEEAQVYSEASLSALYEALPDAILQTDDQDQVIRAKDPQTFISAFPQSLDALVGQPLDRVLEQESSVKDEFLAFYQQTKISKTMQTFEYSMTTRTPKAQNSEQNSEFTNVHSSEHQNQRHTVYREARAIPLSIGGCVILIRDISEGKQATLALEHALSEKDILLRELHHRVKNNLQVIASMLSLQASAAPNDAARALLKESYHRVHVMSEVHQRFYDVENNDAKEQNISQYLRDLINNLTLTLSTRTTAAITGTKDTGTKDAASTLQVFQAIDDATVPIDQIVPLGLIANELLTNVFKYAFPKDFTDRPPTLWVAVIVKAKQLCLIVRDNGVGLANSVKLAGSSSLGTDIVHALAGQLGGRVVIQDASATAPSDMPQLDVPAALADSSGTVAQVCIPYHATASM